MVLVMVCYDLVHQIRCAKHTLSGQCEITPMMEMCTDATDKNVLIDTAQLLYETSINTVTATVLMLNAFKYFYLENETPIKM